jgi:hypothetical protein
MSSPPTPAPLPSCALPHPNSLLSLLPPSVRRSSPAPPPLRPHPSPPLSSLPPQEISMVRSLHYQHIVLHLGEARHGFDRYLLMEWMGGGTVRQMLDARHTTGLPHDVLGSYAAQARGRQHQPSPPRTSTIVACNRTHTPQPPSASSPSPPLSSPPPQAHTTAPPTSQLPFRPPHPGVVGPPLPARVSRGALRLEGRQCSTQRGEGSLPHRFCLSPRQYPHATLHVFFPLLEGRPFLKGWVEHSMFPIGNRSILCFNL